MVELLPLVVVPAVALLVARAVELEALVPAILLVALLFVNRLDLLLATAVNSPPSAP